MPLVNGFQNISPVNNIATNGMFRVNQRGNFGSWTPVVVNDYLCDVWKMTEINIDYCEALHSSAGSISFRGYGRKGQYFIMKNMAGVSNPGYLGYGDFQDPSVRGQQLTAAIRCESVTGTVKAGVAPRRVNTGGQFAVHFYQPIVRAGERATAIQAIDNVADGGNIPDSGSDCSITLMADGDFEFQFYNYRELTGLYRNPPTFCPVDYGEDIIRCKRYYQTGQVYKAGMAANFQSNRARIFEHVDLLVEMAGTPTISMETADIYCFTGGGGGNTETGVTPAISQETNKSFVCDWDVIDPTRYSLAITYGFTLGPDVYTAEI